MIIFPDIGGNLIYARHIVAALQGRINCYGIRVVAPEQENFDGLTLEALAEKYADSIFHSELPGPVYMLGHSFAGLAAYETARQFKQLGRAPDGLFILDMPAISSASLASKLASPGKSLMAARDGVVEMLRSLLNPRATPKVLHRFGYLRIDLEKHPQSYREIITGFYRMLTKYRPHPSDLDITIFTAVENPLTQRWGHDLGWSKYSSGTLRMVPVSGDHLTMIRDQDNAADLAEIIVSGLLPFPWTPG